MRCLISKSHDPWFNLASEEYLLRNSIEEIFLLYINEPCIVVGKHQNLYSEINHKFSRLNNIKLARRISGGGAVYQDFNNLNFSFIHNCHNRDQINFAKFTLPILEALREMGLDVEFSGRNDLLINSQKISGNAMHVYKNRVLSHGTLLFNTDLNQLSQSLRSNDNRYIDKSIKSVRSKVTNISHYLDYIKTIEYFTDCIFKHVLSNNETSYVHSLEAFEEQEINKIAVEKFETWKWIYGYSPKYVYKNTFKFGKLIIHVEFSVERGLISNTRIITQPQDNEIESQLCKILSETLHDFETIEMKLRDIEINNSYLTDNLSNYCDQLF